MEALFVLVVSKGGNMGYQQITCGIEEGITKAVIAEVERYAKQQDADLTNAMVINVIRLDGPPQETR